MHEELRAALGVVPYERSDARRGYRNGTKTRMLTGPTGLVALTVPRATLFSGGGEKEWTSAIVPRYQRRMPEVNEAVIATYLAGGNTRRIRGALQPLLKTAPLSKSAVSRVVATLKDGLEAWRTRSLTDLDVIYVYLDGCALRVRSAGKVVSVPILGIVGVLSDGHKHLLALELCGGESFVAWKGCLESSDAARTAYARSSARGPNVALASWPVFEKAATSCSRSSPSPRRSGKRSGPPTRSSDFTRSFDGG